MGLVVWVLLIVCVVQTPQRRPAAPAPRTFFTSPVPADQMKGKQAVIQTAQGAIVIDLLPEAAPNHVAYFIKLANDGAFAGTTFHRVIKHGIIQGGDPISRDPAKRELYGTGGLRMLKAEPSAEKQTRGAVSAVLLPNDADSAGSQFFINITDQPNIQGQYTVFGRVVDGIEVAQKISEAAVDDKGRTIERIAIESVTIRDRPGDPFADASPQELAAYRARLDTTHGAISSRREKLREAQQRVVRNLQPEFNDTRHVKGIVAMARGGDPASATTSFFFVTGDAPALDGKYTAFGRVVDGLTVVEKIEAVAVNGEAPVDRIEIAKVRIEKVVR